MKPIKLTSLNEFQYDLNNYKAIYIFLLIVSIILWFTDMRSYVLIAILAALFIYVIKGAVCEAKLKKIASVHYYTPCDLRVNPLTVNCVKALENWGMRVVGNTIIYNSSELKLIPIDENSFGFFISSSRGISLLFVRPNGDKMYKDCLKAVPVIAYAIQNEM